MANHSKSAEARHPSRKEKRHNEAKRSVEDPSHKCVRDLKSALAKREVKRIATIGLYSLRVAKGHYGVPFCAASDALALQAAKELLPLSNVYRVGSFCFLDGKVISLNRPLVVLDNKVA